MKRRPHFNRFNCRSVEPLHLHTQTQTPPAAERFFQFHLLSLGHSRTRFYIWKQSSSQPSGCVRHAFHPLSDGTEQVQPHFPLVLCDVGGLSTFGAFLLWGGNGLQVQRMTLSSIVAKWVVAASVTDADALAGRCSGAGLTILFSHAYRKTWEDRRTLQNSDGSESWLGFEKTWVWVPNFTDSMSPKNSLYSNIMQPISDSVSKDSSLNPKIHWLRLTQINFLGLESRLESLGKDSSHYESFAKFKEKRLWLMNHKSFSNEFQVKDSA